LVFGDLASPADHQKSQKGNKKRHFRLEMMGDVGGIAWFRCQRLYEANE
jgi:hypothetical protein